jgi:hypothetical protein
VLLGILRKNVTLVQKSSKTSVEQSFFAGCPCAKDQITPAGVLWAGEKWREKVGK